MRFLCCFSHAIRSPSVPALKSIDGQLKQMAKQLQVLDKMGTSISKIMTCVLPPLESNIAEDIPDLPLCDKSGEKAMNELLKDKGEFNKVVSIPQSVYSADSSVIQYCTIRCSTTVSPTLKSIFGR